MKQWLSFLVFPRGEKTKKVFHPCEGWETKKISSRPICYVYSVNVIIIIVIIIIIIIITFSIIIIIIIIIVVVVVDIMI